MRKSKDIPTATLEDDIQIVDDILIETSLPDMCLRHAERGRE